MQSGERTKQEGAFVSENFLLKTFGDFEEKPYLCTRKQHSSVLSSVGRAIDS